MKEAQSIIAELKSEIGALRAGLVERENAEQEKLKQAQTRIAELENTTPAGVQDLPYTLWKEVLAMRREEMSDKQIAARLNDKGQGVSRSQLGALLYTGKEKLPACKTLQDKGTELFR